MFVEKMHIRVNQTYSYVKRDVYIRACAIGAQAAGVYVVNIHLYVKKFMCEYKMMYIYVLEVSFGGKTREYVTEVCALSLFCEDAQRDRGADVYVKKIYITRD